MTIRRERKYTAAYMVAKSNPLEAVEYVVTVLL